MSFTEVWKREPNKHLLIQLSTLEKGIRYFIDVVLVSLLLILNICTAFSRICITDVEHVFFFLLENDMLNLTSVSVLKREKEKLKKRSWWINILFRRLIVHELQIFFCFFNIFSFLIAFVGAEQGSIVV